MKASYVVWLGVNLREELLRIWTFCFTRFCSVLRRKISFTDCVDEDSWDEDNSHTACSRNFLFPRSPSSLAFRLFIVLNLDSFHGIFFRGARIRRRMTFDTHENLKTKNKNTTMIRTPANFFVNVKNLQRIVEYIRKGRIGILEYSKRKAEFA